MKTAPLLKSKAQSLTLDEFLKIQKDIIGKIKFFETKCKKQSHRGHASDPVKKPAAEHFYRGRKGFYTYFQNLSEGHIADKISPNNYVRATMEEDKWHGGSRT
jgi:hypothetical protein